MSSSSSSCDQHSTADWRLVKPNDELPFFVGKREKLRHKVRKCTARMGCCPFSEQSWRLPQRVCSKPW